MSKSKRTDLLRARLTHPMYVELFKHFRKAHKEFMNMTEIDLDKFQISAKHHDVIMDKIKEEDEKYPRNSKLNQCFPVFKFRYKGFMCYIGRNPHNGCLNGYVKNLPLKRYEKLYVQGKLSFHGGITFTEKGVVGFDTGHCSDYMPFLQLGRGYDDSERRFVPTYKTFDFVKLEIIKVINTIQFKRKSNMK